MQVLYDIATLGIGYRNPHSKTGIYRVAENLAYGLQKSQECDLRFCASGPSSNLTGAFDWLKATSEFSDVPLASASAGIVWEFKRVLHRTEMSTHLQVNKTSGVEKIQLRLRRKLLHSTALLTEAFYRPDYGELFNGSDIYHSPFQPLPECLRKSSTKKFLTVHDLIPILHSEFFVEQGEANSTNRAIASLDSDSWILCVSQATKNDLCNHVNFIDPNQVFVTHLAASEKFYPCSDPNRMKTIREKYRIPEAPYILSLSTLEPRKNIDHVIRCFFDLIQQERIQDLHLVLVGAKGWKYDGIFEQLTGDPRLRERVILTGYVADEDLAAIYSNALAFIYVSFYEGFGLPPLEAMQCGIPVITSNTSSLPEVVGDAGITIDPTDADTLCSKLALLYQNSSVRESLSLKSLEQASKFSWNKCVEETIQAYKTALND